MAHTCNFIVHTCNFIFHTCNFCRHSIDTPKGLKIHLASCNRKRNEVINNLQLTPSDTVQKTSNVIETTDIMNAEEILDIIREEHNLAFLPPHKEVSFHPTQPIGEMPGN